MERSIGWEVHGKELIISVVRDLTDSLLVYFPALITVAYACR